MPSRRSNTYRDPVFWQQSTSDGTGYGLHSGESHKGVGAEGAKRIARISQAKGQRMRSDYWFYLIVSDGRSCFSRFFCLHGKEFFTTVFHEDKSGDIFGRCQKGFSGENYEKEREKAL